MADASKVWDERHSFRIKCSQLMTYEMLCWVDLVVKPLVSLTSQIRLHVRTDYPRTVVGTIVLNRRG